MCNKTAGWLCGSDPQNARYVAHSPLKRKRQGRTKKLKKKSLMKQPTP